MEYNHSNSNILRRTGAGMASVRTRASPATATATATHAPPGERRKPTSKSEDAKASARKRRSIGNSYSSYRNVFLLCFLVLAISRMRPDKYTFSYATVTSTTAKVNKDEENSHYDNHYHAPNRPKLVHATNVTSIPPSKMKVHYHELWNHSTSTIDIPEEYQNPFGVWIEQEQQTPPQQPQFRRPLTSLEILQNVLHGDAYRPQFEAVEAFMADETGTTPMPSCLVPDLGATHDLAQKVVQARRQRDESRSKSQSRRRLKRTKKPEPGLMTEELMLPLPILNMGYPKVGSSSLRDYLECLGLVANHGQNGILMQENLANGKKLYSNYLDEDYRADAYTQLDRNADVGYYPQITLLDEFHELTPDATLVFLFRPVSDWIPSITNWMKMKMRMSKFILPGLVLTPQQLERNQWSRDHPHKKKALVLSDVQLAKWWCGHALHIREYVKEYPSHSLIELDLYDTNGTSRLLYDLLHADANAYHDSRLLEKDAAGRDGTETGTGETTEPKKRPQCVWGQSNKSTDLKKNREIARQKKLERLAQAELKKEQQETGNPSDASSAPS